MAFSKSRKAESGTGSIYLSTHHRINCPKGDGGIKV
jgi:hypothetical protein